VDVAEDKSGCLGEVIGRLTGGLELLEQGQRLATHSLLHQWQLMQPGTAEDRLEPNAGGCNSRAVGRLAAARHSIVDGSGGQQELESARSPEQRKHPDVPARPDGGPEKLR
jgi:hypothetical protein